MFIMSLAVADMTVGTRVINMLKDASKWKLVVEVYFALIPSPTLSWLY